MSTLLRPWRYRRAFWATLRLVWKLSKAAEDAHVDGSEWNAYNNDVWDVYSLVKSIAKAKRVKKWWFNLTGLRR